MNKDIGNYACHRMLLFTIHPINAFDRTVPIGVMSTGNLLFQ